jgi:hypothetical protein
MGMGGAPDGPSPRAGRSLSGRVRAGCDRPRRWWRVRVAERPVAMSERPLEQVGSGPQRGGPRSHAVRGPLRLDDAHSPPFECQDVAGIHLLDTAIGLRYMGENSRRIIDHFDLVNISLHGHPLRHSTFATGHDGTSWQGGEILVVQRRRGRGTVRPAKQLFARFWVLHDYEKRFSRHGFEYSN